MKPSKKRMTQDDVINLLQIAGFDTSNIKVPTRKHVARRPAKVTRLTPQERVYVTTCKQAIYASMIELGGKARVKDVAEHVEKHYRRALNRPWKRSTIYNYCIQLSRPQLFTHVSHGVYGVLRAGARKAA